MDELPQTSFNTSLKVRARRRSGFSLVEAILAISITALAGSVLLLGVESSLRTTSDAVDRTIADGLARQLLDEIATKRFMAPGTSSTATPFGPTALESAGSGRERFDDADDYHAFAALPAEGVWGETLGTGDDFGAPRHAAFQVPAGYFDRWRQRVEVYFVDPTDHRVRLSSGTSQYRAIEVHIEYVDPDGVVLPLASRRRVIAYVPAPTT